MTGSDYRNVLVPTDGSNLAVEALREALSLAELTDATIHVLYVVDDAKIAELASGTGIDDVSVDGDVDGLFERFEAIGEHALDDLREAATDRGLTLTTAIRRGLPEEEILAYVEETEIDLLVMGTHGRRGIERYILGSTTERVLRKSPVPVLTVRENASGE
ncbi:universal stress protein [Halorubellus sp. PRR65]|uniref:universal stress protein n=1 Tax=Halorubellus sp. PRR65 TaxID=3098148 RepID=UPI002B262095|nr:universal stress protein [Halorubellus sp. PRR65]